MDAHREEARRLIDELSSEEVKLVLLAARKIAGKTLTDAELETLREGTERRGLRPESFGLA